MPERLFVYGTLGPGRPNEHLLKAIGGTWQQASVKCTLLEEGWGADMGYPGIKLTESAMEVAGFLFTSDHLCKHWPTLDEFEGDAYLRVMTEVKLADNSTVRAHIYTIK